MRTASESTQAFRRVRDTLLRLRDDHDQAYREFRWPELDRFNWATDWFDVVSEPDRTALSIVEADGSRLDRSFADMSRNSNRVANWLRGNGVAPGDRVLVMLNNQVELWETVLACMKLGAVIIPATTLLSTEDVRDRVERGDVRHVVVTADVVDAFRDVPGDYTRVAVGAATPGWLAYADGYAAGDVLEAHPTRGDDPMLLYFTSGTTANPKLVEHTHASYPAGHLSTMYWIGLRPGDVHLNVSSPGWAKHAWSSLFAPWNAEATILVYNYSRFDANAMLDVVVDNAVTTFCAPPTVWRMLIQQDLSRRSVRIRDAVAAGEPLNPEVIDQVQKAWGITVRDGFGQTETTAQVGNSPGLPVRVGAMGRPLPGYAVELLDPVTGRPGDEGEIALDLSKRPLGLMTGYRDDPERTDDAFRDGYYRTGDIARRDREGYLTYVGRADDVFKSSDYRISPFELESVLLEHDAVAEAAVVPSPDELRLSVPKAYVTLAADHEPTAETALSIFAETRLRLAPYKRIRRLEFAELPKTISGKIRRVDLRRREHDLRADGDDNRADGEYQERDFPQLTRNDGATTR
ncbi:AMP-binding protein [Actinophytocola sp.]|uniref:AMP-binding protein n=1 Tax=Actinophytocola sp. TaxID=1872138 RepID=UPI003D6A5810